MTQGHTPEPWHWASCIDSSGKWTKTLIGNDGQKILTCDANFDHPKREDIKRIGQCVNACAGISDPESFINSDIQLTSNLSDCYNKKWKLVEALQQIKDYDCCQHESHLKASTHMKSIAIKALALAAAQPTTQRDGGE